MRLKKKYTVVIVAIMVVLTAVLASFIVNSVQGSRIAYVAVSADKASYGMDENVTFKLRPLSQGIQFTVNGIQGGGGVHIVRLPDDVDPESINTDSSLISNLSMWQNRYSSGQNAYSNLVIPIPQFNSTGEALELSWNGTISVYDRGTNDLTWGKASAGNYVLYPSYSWEYGHSVKFMLDRSSIFYYGGLQVEYNVTTDGHDANITAQLTLPESGATISGYLSSFVPGAGNFSSCFHNMTVDFVDGRGIVSIPTLDHGFGTFTTSMDASITVNGQTYVFGFYQYTSYQYTSGYNGKESVVLVQY